MRKYWHVIKLGMQNALVYRTNFFFRSMFNLIPLVTVIILWHAVYSSGSNRIAGYTLAHMIMYYVLVCLIDSLTAITEDDWQIANEIKDGHISHFLVKPMDYLPYRLCLFTSGRLIYTAAAVLPVCLFLALQYDYLTPPASGLALVCFIISVAMSAIIQFFLSFALAMLAFWVLEISSFMFILLALQRVASGQMFPLDILPSALHQTLMLSPFAYQAFFPVSVYMGRTTGLALAQGLAIQALWVGLTYWLALAAWKRGVRSYVAVGG